MKSYTQFELNSIKKYVVKSLNNSLQPFDTIFVHGIYNALRRRQTLLEKSFPDNYSTPSNLDFEKVSSSKAHIHILAFAHAIPSWLNCDLG